MLRGSPIWRPTQHRTRRAGWRVVARHYRGIVTLFDDFDSDSSRERLDTEAAFAASVGLGDQGEPNRRPDTWSVAQVSEWVTAAIDHVFPDDLWVEGEIADLSRSTAGHAYFTLIEPGADRHTAEHTLAVTLFSRNRQRVNTHLKRAGGAVRMEDGVRVRIRGGLQLYSQRSRLQLNMVAIDPTFTLGDLESRRQQILTRLSTDGLIEANRRLALSPLPLRVGLVTSVGSAAYADFVHELEISGIGFELLAADARVQGLDAESTLCNAIAHLARLDVDVVAIVRGGGARTDLAAFDAEAVARAVAACTVPVWAGIGHEIDRTIVDEVAHTSFKTPTACADALVERVRAGHSDAEMSWLGITRRAGELMSDATGDLDRVAATLGRRAEGRVAVADERLGRLADRLKGSSLRLTDRAEAQIESAAASLVRRPTQLLAVAGDRLDSAHSRVRAYDPVHTLARGWSLTRRADGYLVRSTDDVASGDRLTTQLADGTVESVAGESRSNT